MTKEKEGEKVSFEEDIFIGMIIMGTIIGIFIGMIIGIGLLVGEYCCNFNLAVLALLSIVAIILILISLLCESLDCWKACKGCKNQIFLVILTIVVIIIGVVIGTYLYYQFNSATFKAFILSWILIGTFILSLICMNYMTCKAYQSNESKGKREERIPNCLSNEIEELKEQASQETDPVKKKELEGQRTKKEKLYQSLLLEPVGVLDKHEIRRSLTISITITYFVLLALSIFGIGELTPDSDMIDLFTKAFLVMIAFYFGSRAVEEGIKLYKTMKNEK
uniref:Uncharacterized protein n=1 Tax=Candidatus Methanophagaceae archaeon ANME-1 ERB6 TaxID=2759912 RepID=A0A7G9YSJ4_9EURY|nr:hypothetical protein LCGFKGIO_00011 [Methanosarcinales archaeon ANME-1 ERB6]